jgi:Protein of unknown function (DUF3606)
MPLTKPELPKRNQIKAADVKHWSKHWKVKPEQIQMAIGKVGNSVVAVEKELGLGKPETNPMESQPVHEDAATPMAPAPTKIAKDVKPAGPAVSEIQAKTARQRSLKKQRIQIASGKR